MGKGCVTVWAAGVSRFSSLRLMVQLSKVTVAQRGGHGWGKEESSRGHGSCGEGSLRGHGSGTGGHSRGHGVSPAHADNGAKLGAWSDAVWSRSNRHEVPQHQLSIRPSAIPALGIEGQEAENISSTQARAQMGGGCEQENSPKTPRARASPRNSSELLRDSSRRETPRPRKLLETRSSKLPRDCIETPHETPRNSAKLLKNPSRLHQNSSKTPRNSSKLLETPRNSSRLLETPRNSSKLLETPRNSAKLLEIPRNSSRLLETPRDSSRLLKTPRKKTPQLRETPRNSAKLRETPRNSSKLLETPRNSAKLLENSSKLPRKPLLLENSSKLLENSLKLRSFEESRVGSQGVSKSFENFEEFSKSLDGFSRGFR